MNPDTLARVLDLLRRLLDPAPFESDADLRAEVRDLLDRLEREVPDAHE